MGLLLRFVGLHCIICWAWRTVALLWGGLQYWPALRECLLFLLSSVYMATMIANHTRVLSSPRPLYLVTALWSTVLLWPRWPKFAACWMLFVAVALSAPPKEEERPAAFVLMIVYMGVLCIRCWNLLPLLLLLSPVPQVLLLIDGWRTWYPAYNTWRAAAATGGGSGSWFDQLFRRNQRGYRLIRRLAAPEGTSARQQGGRSQSEPPNRISGRPQ